MNWFYAEFRATEITAERIREADQARLALELRRADRPSLRTVWSRPWHMTGLRCNRRERRGLAV